MSTMTWIRNSLIIGCIIGVIAAYFSSVDSVLGYVGFAAGTGFACVIAALKIGNPDD